MFDLIVLGGGPAGYLAAERAASGGMSVCLFEERSLGGVCLNEGCIPTKTLLYSAKALDFATHGAAYGLHTKEAFLDHREVIARKNNVVEMLVGGVAAKMKAGGITVVPAHGIIAGKTSGGFRVSSESGEHEAKRLLVASGSEAAIPPIPGIKEGLASGFILTSRELLDIEAVPQRLTVIGGGVIGLEMASYFQTAGSQVTVIEMLDQIGGALDPEISGILLRNLKNKGIDFRLSARVTEVSNSGVTVVTSDGTEVIPADQVLLCTGRKPVASGLGLESIGVYIDRGAIVTDQNLRTNVPEVYAAGDVNGKMMFAHTAYREAETAVKHMLGKSDFMRYDSIPSVVYTTPEAAGVGQTEESARAAGIPVKVAKVSMQYSGRYLAETDNGDGICKLVSHEKEHRLLGVHLIGSYASEIILSAAMMVESRRTIDALKELVFPHPTVGEVIREALFELE